MSFSELQIGMSTPPAIVGEVVAGEAAATLKQVKALVKGISVNTFDLAELLHKVRKNKYYQPKFDTYVDYIKTLDIKTSKAYYLPRIVEVMEDVGIPREIYEPVGLAKLRTITRLDVKDKDGNVIQHEGVPMNLIVKDLIEQADKYDPEALQLKVSQMQGLIGDNASGGWVNFPVTVAQRAQWEKAVALAKLNIGSVAQDKDTGNFKDASVGAVAEVIAVSYLLDPNNTPEGTDDNQYAETQPAGTGTPTEV